MSSKIYFNTRRFSPSKLLLGLGTVSIHQDGVDGISSAGMG